jgi:hypothetical protein
MSRAPLASPMRRLPVTELCLERRRLSLPHGSLGLAGLRCGRRARTTDMGVVGGVPGDGGFVGVMNSGQVPLF